jgi:hypothetical protein
MNYYHFLKNILIIYSGNNSPMESDLEGSLCNCRVSKICGNNQLMSSCSLKKYEIADLLD